MSSKWADYLVSAVKYKNTETKERISHLKVHVDEGEKVGSGNSLERQEVISKIKSGYSFCTIYTNSGKWNKGAEIHVITIDNSEFLRTDANSIKADNLGELPEF